MQIGSVAVDTESPGRRQLVPAIATGEQADAQHSCAPRGKQIPHRVADYVAVARVDAELLLAPQEEVRLGFRAEDVAAIDHHHVRGDPERRERAVYLRMPA